MKDLTGQRFGRLTALRPTEERRSGAVVWECKCDCGKITYPSSIYLCAGRVSSCGCLLDESRKKKGKNVIDLTGRRFGSLQVLYLSETRKGAASTWMCRCDCGKDVLVSGSDLRTGRITTCDDVEAHGMRIRGWPNKQDLTGQRFGRLVLLGLSDRKQGPNRLWECRCDCGNTTIVRLSSLQRGVTTSCSCLKKEKQETALHNNEAKLIGKTFGRLTVIRATDTMLYGTRAWECKCDCGNTVLATKSALISGEKCSCGCLLKEWQTRNNRKPDA